MSPARQRLFIATLTAAVALTACSSDTGDRVAGPGELGPVSYTHLTLPTIYSV